MIRSDTLDEQTRTRLARLYGVRTPEQLRNASLSENQIEQLQEIALLGENLIGLIDDELAKRC